ncbi:MAG TPA: penicillin-binding protein 2 [Solirubrobacterales bacterium]|nr:penicillin-binding protein 2 [Solirubrobacterales bacterium]
MNRPIVHIFAFSLLLFGLLVAWTSRWTVFEASELEANNLNRRGLIAEQQIRRGSITTVDGVLVAESEPRGGRGGEDPVYVRTYPQGELFGNPVGYNFVNVGRTGIESSENDLLVGEENEFQSLVDQLRGVTQEGADVTLTIDAEAQRVATESLQAAISVPDTGAAAVAIEPDTGAVRAMVSVPGFDSNLVQDPAEFKRLSGAEGPSPLVNRAAQSTYPPGSTMKVVTAAAGLDSGEIEPATVLNADSPKQISGVPLQNSGGQSFGDIDATTALTNSVNTYWAQVGERLGAETMVEYMERFGFYDDPRLDYPAQQMRASGVYNVDGDLVRGRFDVGRVAIGQGGEEGQILASALQMAQVAGTIANRGVLMEPTLLQEAIDPDGRRIEELDPSEQGRVISEEAADQLAEMMTNVTREGTAAGLSVPGAAEFSGKTGTSEINLEGLNQPWFIGFAPADDPRIAVAVTVERCQGCFGGEVAGPIATELMGLLLQ